MLRFYWLIVLFPLAGAALAGLLGRRLSHRLIGWLCCSAIGLSFAAALAAFVELSKLPEEARDAGLTLFTWIQSGDLTVRFALLLDPLSAVMILVVTGVGFLIHVYSVGYMAGEAGFYRFFSYLNLFIFMMSILVLADNYLLMFVGWEGVGLCSYLLIGYYFERRSAGDAAKKAFIVNRIGDFGFVLGAFLIFRTFGSFDYQTIFSQVSSQFPAAESGFGVLSAITLLLFVGATGKSAQIPLYVWLPDAMEGPTPVSALIHAATMVTAGVYMVVRSNALYSRTPEVLLIVAAVGIATALLSAAIAVVQTDIKRVLAYSTVSQLGYMFVAAGVGAFSASIFHLTTHAFFKALLFLGSGSVILALHHEQDLFRMGGLRRCLPTTCLTMWLATCAISGVPLFSGFFSKDEILWKTLSSPLGHWSLWLAGVFVAGMTACYMFRLMLLAFHGEPSGHSDSAHTHTPHEPSKLVTFPLIVLAFLSVAGGLLGLPGYLGANVLEHFLEPVFRHASLPPAPVHESHGLELAATLAAILAGVAGMWAAYRAYVRDRDWPRRLACRFAGLYSAASRKFMVDEAYDRVLIHPVRDLSANLLWRRIDVGAVDYLVNGAGATAQRWGGFLRRMQSGYIREYAAWILTGLVLICLYLYFAYV